jgi:conjugative transposon TraN protein
MFMIKTISVYTGIILISFSVSFGQDVENKKISICYSKTTSLIFPFSITSVDRGSQDILAQKARGVENVLQIKAGRKQFPETNLTVITADGVLHQFTVTYSDAPSSQAVNIAKNSGNQSLILVKDIVNERDIQVYSQQVLRQKVTGRIDQQNKYQMTLSLQDIFIHDNTLYYRIQVTNKSSISYDIKSLKFLIRDRKKVKRTSSQEIVIIPLYIGNDSERIQAYASTTLIYAVKKFTIPDGKTVFINLFEENGGRHLSLKVGNKDILKAQMLPETKHLLTIN